MKFGIAGAGLMGRLVAWQLLRRGHQVSVFDQDSMKGEASAARVAAAMLAPFSEVVSCERCVFDWGLRGLDLWPQLIQQLSADSGHETPFQRRGSVLVAHPQDQNLLIHLHQKLQACVSDYRESIESLDQSALQKLEPSLADTFTQGIFFRDEGCIDNWCLLDNLASAITSLGGEWNSGVTVEKVSAGALYIDQQKHSFDWVIDVRGVGAKNRFSDLRGVRGEVLWVSAPQVKLSRPVRLMHPRYQLYIAPKPGGKYVIGATEIESESMAPITVRSSLELLSALYSVHTGFAEANILHAYANCRPAFMNNLPRIEKEEGLLSINGLYRHGYLLAPVVIKAALDALDGIGTADLLLKKS